MRISVDTNAYRAFVDGDPVFVEAIRQADIVAFSAVVLGELRAGFRHGTRPGENEGILRRVLAVERVQIHEVSDATSVIYASVWSTLRIKGVPIPTNDVWIAASCIQNGFTLLSRDAHFDNVPGLETIP